MADLPKFKVQYALEDIDRVDSKAKVLTIYFKKDKQVWEMLCSSAELARNWSKTIKTSMEFSKQEANNIPENIVIEPKQEPIKSEGPSNFVPPPKK